MSAAVGSFEEVAKIAKAANAKATGLWAAMVRFADTQGLHVAGEDMAKEIFKAKEKAVDEGSKVKLQAITAYRSSKSVIISAVKFGIPLTSGPGKVRGKTDVEKDIKAMREPESAIETVRRAVDLAMKKVDALTTKEETTLAYQLAQAFLSKATQAVQKHLPELREAA